MQKPQSDNCPQCGSYLFVYQTVFGSEKQECFRCGHRAMKISAKKTETLEMETK